MRFSFDLGDIRVNVSSTGGVRIGGKIGGLYLSQQVVKSTRKGSKNAKTRGCSKNS